MIHRRPALWLPSYAQGFARCPAEAANPGLWQRLVGLWQMSLGPTGTTLYDISGYGRHGALTNMDPATDWIPSEHGWALDFDGADDYVSLGAEQLAGCTCASRFMWVLRGTTSGTDYLADSTDQAEGAAIRHDGQWDMYLYATGTGLVRPAKVNSASGWEHVGWTWDGTTMQTYLNGVPRTSAADSGAIVAVGGTSLAIGSEFDGSDALDCAVLSMADWDRALTPSEVRLYATDPHAIVRPMLRLPVKPPAAGGDAMPMGVHHYKMAGAL